MADPQGVQISGKPNVSRMNKRPLYLLIVALFCMAAALIYSVNFAHDPNNKKEEKKEEPTAKMRPLVDSDAKGIASPPQEALPLPLPAQSGGLAAAPEPPKKEEPFVVVQKTEVPQDAEAENIRRKKQEAFLTALTSPLAVKRSDPQLREQQQNAAADHAAQIDELPRTEIPGEYNPAADKDKEGFLADRGKADTNWRLPHGRTPGAALEVKTGTVIPGVMITGINSDLPGNIIAQVSQNIFDYASGRHLLIPQGTKLFGVYDSRVVYGQERVLVAWNRIIYPDGSSVSLGAMPGADMSGYAGYEDQVDNHYFRIFGSAMLMALITGGTSYSIDKLQPDNDREQTTMQGELGAAMAAQLGQTTTTLLQKNLNIKPTLKIRPGYQFNIVATKDIVFEQPYMAWR